MTYNEAGNPRLIAFVEKELKLRLTQAGMQSFTGQIGSLVFEDGLSLTDVPAREAVRMSAVMGAMWEDGTSPSPAHALLATVSQAAPVVAPLSRGEDVPEVPALAERPEPVLEPKATPVLEVAPELLRAMLPVATYEELVQIADEKGIAGLRAIAEPLGIKGRKVVELIDALAARFELKPAQAEPAEPVVEAPVVTGA
ncbi:hypothetical protein D9M69_435660 [compost metagenome]